MHECFTPRNYYVNYCVLRRKSRRVNCIVMLLHRTDITDVSHVGSLHAQMSLQRVSDVRNSIADVIENECHAYAIDNIAIRECYDALGTFDR